MEAIHPRCAGVDVSKRDAKVCVRIAGAGRRGATSTVTTWGAFTNQVLALRDHLIEAQVTLVVMEATGAREAVLLPARGWPERDAGQCQAREEHARAQERCLGCGVAGRSRRARTGPRLVRATGADPPAAGPDPDPDRDHPRTRP